MQLERAPIRRALTLATATLLAGPVAGEETGVDLQLSQLYYAEQNRVSVNTSQILLGKTLREGDAVKLGFIYDAMTGASPNGRKVPLANQSQTVPITTASGFSFSAQSGKSSGSSQTWLTEFKDNRTAGTLDWDHSFTRNISTNLGVNISQEDDYRSRGGSAVANIDLDEKRTTISLGASASQDTVDPKGGIPNGLGLVACATSAAAFEPAWIDCNATRTRYKPGDKVSTTVFLGTTQVWNRQTLAQLNFTHSNLDGYLTDPYKQLSVMSDSFDGEVAVVYEKRPDQRSTNSVLLKSVHTLGDQAVNASYRYYWDDWGIRAHTADIHARFDFGARWFLQPHLRYSRQGAADFFRPELSASATKPAYASADHRLGSQGTTTYGIKAGVAFSKVAKLALRIERMTQDYRGTTLPDLDVWIVQVTFRNEF